VVRTAKELRNARPLPNVRPLEVPNGQRAEVPNVRPLEAPNGQRAEVLNVRPLEAPNGQRAEVPNVRPLEVLNADRNAGPIEIQKRLAKLLHGRDESSIVRNHRSEKEVLMENAAILPLVHPCADRLLDRQNRVAQKAERALESRPDRSQWRTNP
jgi:hypothetical protein